MSMSESLEALRRANPRSRPAFAESGDAVRAQIAVTDALPVRRARRRPAGLVRLAAIGAALAVAVGVAALTVRSPGGGPGVGDRHRDPRQGLRRVERDPGAGHLGRFHHQRSGELDVEHVQRGAEHDPGNDERQQQQVAERLAARETIAGDA